MPLHLDDTASQAALAAAAEVAGHDADPAAHVAQIAAAVLGVGAFERVVAPAVKYTYELLADGLTTLSSGLVVTDGALCASVDGTAGLIALPAWDLRFSTGCISVKASKTTAGSVSSIDFVNSSPGSIPEASALFIGFGYVAGSGLCSIAGSRTTPTNTVIVADSLLVDGAVYDVSFFYDKTIVPSSNSGTGKGVLVIAIRDASGAIIGTANRSVTLSAYGARTIAVRTNVSAGGITKANVSINSLSAGYQTAVGTGIFITPTAAETCALWIPRSSNGKLVIAAHGHGGSSTTTGYTTETYRPTWDALCSAGYTVCIPNFGGNLWGNGVAQSILLAVRDTLCATFGLDRRVLLWGDSMGSGLVLAAISLQTLGEGMVRAAYLAEPVCDLDVMYAIGGAYATSLDLAFATVDQRRAYSPILLPTRAVPALFASSATDTTVVKATHTTPMVSRWPAGYSYQLATSGLHGDASHFVAANVVSFLGAF